jgi:hypothetical protein
MTAPSDATRLIVVPLGPATIARTDERTGDGEGTGEAAALEGDGLTLAAEGDGVGVASDTVTEQADNRRRAGTHSFITCENNI